MYSGSTPKIPIDPVEVCSLIQPGGEFSKQVPGFEHREEQVKLVEKIVDAFNNQKILVAEAGTGVGKSLAYLLPAFFSGDRKVIVSTNTKALQDQLFYKDVPAIIKVTGLNVTVALAKGKNNFICLKKADYMDHLVDFNSQEVDYLQNLKQTAEGTSLEYEGMPEGLWEKVGCDDICTHNKCKHFSNCYLFKARKKVQDADVVICNHHLLTCDLALRNETQNYQSDLVLPSSKKLVIDEAHNFEDVFIKNFTKEVSRKGVSRALSMLYNQAKGTGALAKLEKSLEKFRLEVSTIVFEKRIEHLKTKVVEESSKIDENFKTVFSYISNFQKSGESLRMSIKPELGTSHSWKHQVNQKLISIASSLLGIATVFELLLANINEEQPDDFAATILAEISRSYKIIVSSQSRLDRFLQFASDKDLRWVEIYKDNIKFNITPVDISLILKDSFYPNYESVVYTSATLSTNRTFDYIKKKLGIDYLADHEKSELLVDSPFNYKENSILFLPDIQVDPAHPSFADLVSTYVMKICSEINGRTFILFTSFSMLDKVFQATKSFLKSKGIVPLSQSENTKETLIEKYKSHNTAVLFGTSTFWEGVDIQGDKLQCVIITKLPFSVPTEPIVEARMKFIEDQGGNSFSDYMVPEAAIKLKQGFGRLIRSKQDFGSVWFFDNRVTRKGYGKKFINSLPDSRKVEAPFDRCFEVFSEFHKSKNTQT